MDKRKLLQKAQAGSKNIRFEEMVVLVKAFGFELVRVRGSHHIFEHLQVGGLINLQNKHGQAKPYQVKQFLKLIELYHLELEDKR